jgi:hypothetical protein
MVKKLRNNFLKLELKSIMSGEQHAFPEGKMVPSITTLTLRVWIVAEFRGQEQSVHCKKKQCKCRSEFRSAGDRVLE